MLRKMNLLRTSNQRDKFPSCGPSLDTCATFLFLTSFLFTLTLRSSSRDVWVFAYQPESSPRHRSTATGRGSFHSQSEHGKSQTIPPDILPSVELPSPWKATVDYSSANVYISDQYEQLYPEGLRPYFAPPEIKTESIYDARHDGVYDDATKTWKPPSLNSCGFELFPLREDLPEKSDGTATLVADWRDMAQIRNCYLPVLTRRLVDALEKQAQSRDTKRPRKVTDIVYWHPMLRGEQFHTMTRQTLDTDLTPTAAIAGVAHVDIDFGAYNGNAQEIVELVRKNWIAHVQLTDTKNPSADGMTFVSPATSSEKFPVDRLVLKIDSGKRFAVVNAWKNVGIEPITRAPLALMATQYDRVDNLETTKPYCCFPNTIPNPVCSRWYVFPSMKVDEVLLFYQYDRDVTQPSDVWHCALPDITDTQDYTPLHQQESTALRKSFDLRTLILFEEVVDHDKDRFVPLNRIVENHTSKSDPSGTTDLSKLKP